MVWDRRFAVFEGCVAGRSGEVDEVFAALFFGFFDFDGAVRVAAFSRKGNRGLVVHGRVVVTEVGGFRIFRAGVTVGGVDAFVELLWVRASYSLLAF